MQLPSKRPMSERILVANRVCELLRGKGCEVRRQVLGFATPMIEIDRPPLALKAGAVEIKEIVGSSVRTTWAANLNGCRIIWRSLILRKM